jgi:hypothetical protein
MLAASSREHIAMAGRLGRGPALGPQFRFDTHFDYPVSSSAAIPRAVESRSAQQQPIDDVCAGDPGLSA